MSGVGIFHNLTFSLIGFDGDAVAYKQLADMIQDSGGLYLVACKTENRTYTLY